MQRIRRYASIADIAPAQWDALASGGEPFLSHAYLAALEESGSTGPGTGWTPRPAALESDDGTLLAAMPLYEKTHSNGEFVFDWDWAEAYASAGRAYYPKLVSAIPFTPVSGPRVLAGPHDAQALAGTLVADTLERAEDERLSSVHWLFVDPGQTALLEAAGCLIRTGCHFEWRNPGVGNFDEWLARLGSSRRKSIRRERRRVAEAGIRCEWFSGADLDDRRLAVVYELYAANYYAHGMRPYLTPRFFAQLAQTMPGRFSVCLASRGPETIGGALFLEGPDTLYGRYWGAFEWVDCLHFEVCYYQGIERALERGLQRFHPGVQGEHKLLRGFAPTLHYSAHWLRDRDFHDAVARFLERERDAVDAYADAAAARLPYRRHGT